MWASKCGFCNVLGFLARVFSGLGIVKLVFLLKLNPFCPELKVLFEIFFFYQVMALPVINKNKCEMMSNYLYIY